MIVIRCIRFVNRHSVSVRGINCWMFYRKKKKPFNHRQIPRLIISICQNVFLFPVALCFWRPALKRGSPYQCKFMSGEIDQLHSYLQVLTELPFDAKCFFLDAIYLIFLSILIFFEFPAITFWIAFSFWISLFIQMLNQ